MPDTSTIEDRRTRSVVFPLLPDAEDSTFDVFPHPDGRPWLKACTVCAARTHDPQGLGDRYQQQVMDGTPGTLFYCLHRASDPVNGEECHRVCASYAAHHIHEARALQGSTGE